MFCEIYIKKTKFRTKIVTNGYAVRVYGLILCQDEATACTDLLEAFLAYFRAISDRNLRKNLEIQNSRNKNVQKS